MSDGVEPVEASRAERPMARDPVLDRLVELVADLLDVPVAFLALFHGGHARLVAQTGLDPEAARRGVAADALLGDGRTRVVPDAAQDGRVGLLPLLSTPPGFYAGTPLTHRDGTVFGVVCAVDAAPRAAPSGRDLRRLEDLAALACDALENRRAIEQAEALAESRTELLADLSHELRTPLNGIVGFAEILRRDGAGDARLSA